MLPLLHASSDPQVVVYANKKLIVFDGVADQNMIMDEVEQNDADV